MPSLSGTGANPLLIEIVRKTLEDANEKKDNTYSRIEKAEDLGSNKLGVRLPVVLEDNASQVWRSTDGGDFAQSGAEVYGNLTVTHTRMYMAAEFTADIRQMDERGPVVTGIVTGAVARANKRLKKNLNQFLFGDGSGEVARYSSGTGTATITFTSTSGNYFGSSKILKNGRYQWYDSTLATARNSGYVFTVSSVDRANKQAVFDVAPTLSASDVLVPEGSVSSVINGFGNMIGNSGAIHGQTRGSTNPSLNNAVIAAAGAPLSASLMGQIENTMAFKTGMEKIGDGYVYIWSPVQRQGYLNLGYDLKQFVNERAGNLDAGFDGTTFGNIQCMTDVDCSDDTVLCVGFDQYKRFILMDVMPQKFPGGDIFWPKTASSGQNYADSWIVNLATKQQIGIPNPKNGGAKITGLSVSGGVSRHIA